MIYIPQMKGPLFQFLLDHNVFDMPAFHFTYVIYVENEAYSAHTLYEPLCKVNVQYFKQ